MAVIQRLIKRRVVVMLAVVAIAAAALALPAAATHDGASEGAWITGTGGDGVNVRLGPAMSAGIVTTLPEDYSVSVDDGPVLAADGTSWFAVSAETNEGWISGWVLADYVMTSATSVAPDDSDSAARGVPIAIDAGGDGLFIRSEPSSDAEVVAALPDGAWIEALQPVVTNADGVAWTKVRYGDLVGYSASAYIGGGSVAGADGEAASAAGEAIVEAALAYLGTPYLWGGVTPAGFDCSGFTYYLLAEALGYDYPRPIEDQIEMGVYVSQAELAPGDLIFFQNTYQWGLSHVGIYLGDGLMVSATGEHDAVGVSSLSDPYWAARYLTARRIA